MEKEGKWLIVTFDSTTDAMRMEKEAKAAGLPGRIIPLPTQISAGCGLSWRAYPEDKDRLESFMKEKGIDHSSIVVIDAPLRHR